MAHPDLNQLLDALFSFAEEMLAKYGEFYPFAASVKSDGQIAQVAAHTGQDNPASQDLIDLMTQALRQSASSGEIRAAGICLDVLTIPPGQTTKTDAICARLEHQEGEAVEVYRPYTKNWRGKIKFGDVFASQGIRTIFSTD